MIKNHKKPKTAVFAATIAVCAVVYSKILPASPALDLTPAEETRVQYCEAGAAELDPHIIAECLNEKELLDKLAKRNPNRWLLLTRKTDVLKDITDILDINTDACALNKALALRLENEAPASKAGLGPEPEKFIDWATKYRRDKLDLAKKAVRNWDVLMEEEKAWLKANGFFSDKWSGLALADRNRTLAAFAKMEAQKLLQTPVELDENTYDLVFNAATSIYCDLDSQTRANLKKHLRNLQKMRELGEKTAGLLKNNPPELRKFEAELKNIKNLSVSEQFARMNVFFENNPELKKTDFPQTANFGHVSAAAGSLTPKEAKAVSALLQTALLKEIKGTIAGDTVANFLKKHPLSIKIKAIDTYSGYFDPDTKAIIFSKNMMVKDWIEGSGYTSEDLLTKPEAIKEMARYLAPLFVHEATHYDQVIWYESKNLSSPYSQDSEIEAMSVEALYAIEKSLKDTKFREMVSSKEEFFPYLRITSKYIKQFQEDPREFRRITQHDYAYAPSFETAESKILSEMPTIITELERREKLPGEEQKKLRNLKYNGPKNPTADIATELGTRELEKIRDSYRYRHFELKKRIESHVKWADDTLKKILAEETPSPLTEQTVPPPGK